MHRLFLAVLMAHAILAGQNACAPDPAAHAALQIWLNDDTSPLAEQRRSMDELAAKYLGDFPIQQQRMRFYRLHLYQEWAAVRESYVKRAEQNPDDPLSLTLGATALYHTDTPRAIAWLTKVRERWPAFSPAALTLAEIYAHGRFDDKDKARTNFQAYASACAEYLTRQADRIMSRFADTPIQTEVAKRMRTRLDQENSPDAEDYELLWSLEFRSRPPAEYAAIRKRVAKDVDRLHALKPDKQSMEILLAGKKQSGASKDELAAFEDRAMKMFPRSSIAYQITYDRWEKEHKQPENSADTEAWEAWKRAKRLALEQWAVQFTEAAWLPEAYANARIDAGEFDEKQAVSAVEQSLNKHLLLSNSNWWYPEAARRLLKKGWAPDKSYTWMQKACPDFELGNRTRLEDDALTDAQRREIAEAPGFCGELAPDYLRAMKLAAANNVPASLRAYLEGPMPAKKADWSSRYQALAWLASVDGHEADALAYFQQALFTREKVPQYFQGKLEDPLLDQAKTAFLKTGGTEKAFALWSQPSNNTQQLAEGRWEKPTKTLASFDLADVTGKTWKLKQLEGKAVMINLWATWCGPCKRELPYLQKLHEQTKDSPDVQVISFNIDEDAGLVEPFLKENGFTFPALMAFGLVRGMFDSYGIPQNWLIDPKGNWLATQMGFDATDTDWVNSMRKRLDAARQGKAPALAE